MENIDSNKNHFFANGSGKVHKTRCEKSMAIRPGVSDDATSGQPASFISRDLTRKHSI